MSVAMLLDAPADLTALSHQQHQVVSRSQLRDLGVSRHVVRSAVRGQRWQTLGERVVVLHTGPLTQRQRAWVAVLHAGPHSALCGLSAAIAGGLCGFQSSKLHVIVPKGVSVPPLEGPVGLVVHESRRFSSAAIHPARVPARTRVARSVVDAASWAASAALARSLLCAVVQQRLAPAGALRQEILQAGLIARRSLMLETVDDVEGGSHSLPELEWIQILRAAGLPLPQRQVKIRRPDGTYYLDAEWTTYGLGAEINGAQHQEVLIREYDDERHNALVIGKRSMLAFSSYAVRHRQALVAATVEQALRAYGWAPGSAGARVRRIAPPAARCPGQVVPGRKVAVSAAGTAPGDRQGSTFWPLPTTTTPAADTV